MRRLRSHPPSLLPHLPHRSQRPTFLLVKVNVEYCSIENTMRELISLTHPKNMSVSWRIRGVDLVWI